MSAQHTPGPWEVESEDSIVGMPCVSADSEFGDWIVCTLDGPTDMAGFCIDRMSAPTIAQIRANACLIAAAPELLEALQWAMAFVPAMSPLVCTDEAIAAKAKAVAAIAKATGASS